jgi:hypothetical protein
MPNPATAPAEPPHPDPDRAVPARLDTAGAGRILRLLHTLIAYGRNVVQTLRETDDPNTLPWFAVLTRIFDTTNPALITIYMIRGLLRAAALQARLGRRFASLPALLLPDSAAKQTRPGGSGPGPRTPRVPGWRTIPPGWPAHDSSLDRLPTPEEQMYAEIVAEDRDREIGPILFDVCVDLGVVPQQMDPATWDELRRAIALYGADPAPFEARHLDLADPAPPTAPDVGHVGPKTAGLIRGHSANGIPSPTGITYPPWPAPRPQFPVPACTGPPEPDN